MDFPEFYKELEAEFLGASAKIMGLQLLKLELRLGKTPSRSYRPVKSAEILWQILGVTPPKIQQRSGIPLWGATS
ncbi:hypothetical protein Tco_0410528 [Tanacetum coccineum]